MNCVQLVGRIGADLELRTSASGVSLLDVRLATKGRRKDGDAWVDDTQWHRLVLFGRTAEVVAANRSKGEELAVTGELRYRDWIDKDGGKRTSTEIIVKDAYFIGGRRDGAPPAHRPAPVPSHRAPAPSARADYDDGIPF